MLTDKPSPFFSIVIPVYNRYDLLVSSISSVLDQSLKDFELIVVDDGSTDGSYENLLKNYGTHPAVRILHQENSERGAARNNGFRSAKGEYVVFFDSDDIMHPEHLEVLFTAIRENDYPDFVATKYDFIKDGKHYPSDSMKLSAGFLDYKTFLHGNPLACNFAVRRDNRELILFEEDRRLAIKEDWIFLLRNLFKHRLYLVDKVTVTMNDHEDRSMRQDHELIVQKTLLANDWIRKMVPFSKAERNLLESHAYYLSAIHSYVAGRRMDTYRYLSHAVKVNGIKKKYISLALKAVAGHNILKHISR